MLNDLKNNWANILSIAVSILGFYFGEMQTIPAGEIPPGVFRITNADTFNSLVENKGIIFFCIVSALVILQYISYRYSQNEQKRWLIHFLRHLTNQHLSGGNYKTRITIFRQRRGWHFFLPHLWDTISNKNHPVSMLPNPFRKYLAIYVRYCSIERKRSFTYFRIKKDTPKKSETLVAECFHTGEIKSCFTDSISGINLPNKFEQLQGSEKRRVKKYMEESMIKDYDTLLTIHTPSNSLLALPIAHEGPIWGVIVFDNISDYGQAPINFKEKIDEDFLNSYQKIVQFTTKLIK